MTYQGTIQNGVVVFVDGTTLPEGTIVEVTPRPIAVPREHAKPIGQLLSELADWAETQPCDLPEDLARNHDHYLHGLPKRE